MRRVQKAGLGSGRTAGSMKAQEEWKGLQLGRLEPEERILTRKLYETVFAEDPPRFVDYYYRRRASVNEIYAAVDEKGIHGMVHLNPCRVSWQGEELTLSYIVAVATEEAYRGQGIMGKLLGMALEEMDRRGEPFTFLMPAAEAIYTPYGFRRAWPWRWEEDAAPAGEIRTVLPAEKCTDETLGQLSRRVNDALSRQFSLFDLRSAGYYRDLQEQQEASGGELRICFDKEGPCFARCTEKEKFPPMMARIVNRKSFLARTGGEGEEPFANALICQVV